MATRSTDFPTASPLQATNAGGQDAFVTKLNPDGSALAYSTYLGGTGNETCLAVVDDFGNAYVTCDTTSTDFPTVSPLQPANAGGSDAIVAKFVQLIDIKPNSESNSINPGNQGVIPVAILTSEVLDALTVSVTTVQFGPGGASSIHPSGHLEDVDKDGDLDLLLHFLIQESGIQCGDTEASLSGQTFDGGPFQASDSIVTAGCRGPDVEQHDIGVFVAFQSELWMQGGSIRGNKIGVQVQTKSYVDLFFVRVFENEEFGIFMEDASHVFLRPVAVYNNGFGIFASGDSYLRTLNSQVTANTTGIFFDLFSHGLLQSTDVSGNGTDTVTDRGGAFFVEP